MSVKVGSWVKYVAAWTKAKDERLAEIVEVRRTHKLTLYGTADGYILTDQMIIESRPPQGDARET